MISQWDSLISQPVNWFKSIFEEDAPPPEVKKMAPLVEKTVQTASDEMAVKTAASRQPPSTLRVAFLDALLKPESTVSPLSKSHPSPKVSFERPVQLQKGVQLHMPKSALKPDNTVDLVIQFRGVVPQRFSEGGVNAMVITAETEGLSGAMMKQFGATSFVPNMMDVALQKAREKYGPDVKLGKLALGSFSAGYAPLQVALSDPAIRERTDAVVVLDGIHYGKAGKPTPAAHQPFVDFAKEAAAGNKLMVITHSEIKPTYSSSTDAADYIARQVGGQRVTDEKGLPDWTYDTRYKYQVAPSSRVTQGDFHVEGYSGGQAKNHVEQIDNLGNIWNRYLATRWEN